ncbi:MAG: type II secretion system F family protein [Bdellovibrionales bacterium]|nr:type II secretion system F family protein [Bdellovibrionales bacterium]
MATFEFHAKAEDGRIVKGELDAANEAEARIRMRAQRLTPLRMEVKRKSGASAVKLNLFGDSVSMKDLQVFTRQFAVLVGAGVPIVQSLEAMSKGARSAGMTNVLQQVTGDVERGRRLADALASRPAVFDRLYVNLIKAGEEGGVLETVLNRLAAYIETTVRLRGKVKGALVYPIAIVIVAIVVIAFIMIFVVPKMSAMFTQSGQKLPALTQIVINCSNFVQSYWYLLVAVLVAVPMVIKLYYETENGRKTCDSIFIEVPVFGDLIKKSAIARFSRTLSTLLASGVRIIDALEISSATTGNWMIEKALIETKEAVSRGKTLAEPLTKIKYFPNMVTQMISIGEQTGNIDQMLSKVADFYEDEVENATDALTSLMEPILMVVLGGIIAIIVVAMYLPIFNLANTIGQ